MKHGYARISTLKKAGCQKIFKDERSGATTKRPALLRCLKKLEHGDTLIVWKLDRLGRSLRDLIAMVEDFTSDIHFRSLIEELNTTTPGGKLIFHFISSPPLPNLNAASSANGPAPE